MNTLMLIQNQLLATKFFVPVPSGHIISRPRLTALLTKSLTCPLTLVSGPAGFGKTTLLATWREALPANDPLVAWVSLDEEDNEPRLFWTAVLTALGLQQPHRFTPLLLYLQPSNSLSLKYVLTAFINLLTDSTEHFVLILDDYQVITEPQVHTTFSYLVEHLPPQLRIILATRADPPLPLSQLRAHRQIFEVRTDQLRCTVEETRAFFEEVIGSRLPAKTIQEVATRTEGWLVGLQLLGLSLPEQANPLTLLEQASGDQRYILDYLTQEILQRQPKDVQTFLLFTSILKHLSASLCDAIVEQSGSQHMLEQLEQANLFVVSLDHKRQWYRYHALFAEALSYRLQQRHADLLPSLHHSASLWYAGHDQTTQAIVHAFKAREWLWAADLIERLPSLLLLTWEAGEQDLVLLRQWLGQLPADIIRTKPRLCLACAHLSWQFAPYPEQEAWLNAATTILTTSLTTHTHEEAAYLAPDLQGRQEQENLLGEVITFRAILQSLEDGRVALSLCQEALALLSPENAMAHTLVAGAQLWACYTSEVNDAMAAIQRGLQAGSIAQAVGYTSLAIALISSTAMHLIGIGRLREAQHLAQQAMQLGKQTEGVLFPDVGWSLVLQAEILREQNHLDAAQDLIEKGIVLCKQTQSVISLFYLLCGYSVLLRIGLSRGELDASQVALEQFEQLSGRIEQHLASYMCSFFTTTDRVRLWLACGEQDHAIQWAKELDLTKRPGTPFAREREEVAHVRILLVTGQPTLALERLEPVLERATAGQRWGHVIEIRLLQALAYQMCHEASQALEVLSEAVRLAEPEGFIRSFIEEGAPMAALLCSLQEKQRKAGPTPYLDTLLAAFPQQSQMYENRLKQAADRTTSPPLLDPLSERELEVLHLLVQGASNQEIAQALVIAVDTVKRHVSHIFSKLGVQNRIQAMKQAQEFRLLVEEH